MIRDTVISLRLDQPFTNAVFNYLNYHRISNQSFGVKKIIKLGLQADLIIRGLDPVVQGTPLEMETAIDIMTVEQREKLLGYLIEKMGIKEISRIRELVDLK